jgi:hypothetical protein
MNPIRAPRRFMGDGFNREVKKNQDGKAGIIRAVRGSD